MNMDKQVVHDKALQAIVQTVGNFIVRYGYCGIKFVHHPEHDHIGVEIIPLPESKVLTIGETSWPTK